MEGKYDAPDGGWGWVVTIAAFMVGMIMDGIGFSFGILFKELLIYFNQGKSLTSWIISVYNGVSFAIGPVAQVLISWFGMRKVAICGALLASISIFLSTFSPNVQVMIVLYGLFGGCGLGLIYFPSIVLIHHYFSSKRGIASGIAYCGSGVGGFVFAPLTEFLITKYSWQGALWIVSAIILNGVPLGALLRPINVQGNTHTERTDMNRSNISKNICSFIHSTLSELKLLKSSSLLLYGTSCFLCALGFYIPFTFIPDLAKSLGMTSQEGALLISIIGILNTIGRVVAGWLVDRLWVEPIKLNSGLLIAGGLATVFVSHYNMYVLLSVYCGVFGLCIAVFITCQPIISVELSGIAQMASLLGIVRLLQGVSTLIGAPVAGMLADYSGNYAGAFYMAGAAIAMAGVLCLPLKCIQRCETGLKQATSNESADNSNHDVESTHL